MKIELVGENKPREVEFYGEVICTESKEYDMSWEFQEGEEYKLYKQTFDDGTDLYIVLNEDSGWYSNYRDINNLSGNTFVFKLKPMKVQLSSLYGSIEGPEFKFSNQMEKIFKSHGMDVIVYAVDLLHLYGIEITEAEVRERYSEPHRHFHTTEHLNDVLRQIIDTSFINHDDFISMIIAGVFHDIVYDPQRTDNEEKSVELLEFHKSIDESEYFEIMKNAKKIILATKTHDKVHELIYNFNKIDCSILDRDYPDLLKWEEEIYNEYKFAGWEQYKERRIRFLKLSIPEHKKNIENLNKLIEYIEHEHNNIG